MDTVYGLLRSLTTATQGKPVNTLHKYCGTKNSYYIIIITPDNYHRSNKIMFGKFSYSSDLFIIRPIRTLFRQIKATCQTYKETERNKQSDRQTDRQTD